MSDLGKINEIPNNDPSYLEEIKKLRPKLGDRIVRYENKEQTTPFLPNELPYAFITEGLVYLFDRNNRDIGFLRSGPCDIQIDGVWSQVANYDIYGRLNGPKIRNKEGEVEVEQYQEGVREGWQFSYVRGEAKIVDVKIHAGALLAGEAIPGLRLSQAKRYENGEIVEELDISYFESRNTSLLTHRDYRFLSTSENKKRNKLVSSYQTSGQVFTSLAEIHNPQSRLQNWQIESINYMSETDGNASVLFKDGHLRHLSIQPIRKGLMTFSILPQQRTLSFYRVAGKTNRGSVYRFSETEPETPSWLRQFSADDPNVIEWITNIIQLPADEVTSSIDGIIGEWEQTGFVQVVDVTDRDITTGKPKKTYHIGIKNDQEILKIITHQPPDVQDTAGKLLIEKKEERLLRNKYPTAAGLLNPDWITLNTRPITKTTYYPYDPDQDLGSKEYELENSHEVFDPGGKLTTRRQLGSQTVTYIDNQGNEQQRQPPTGWQYRERSLRYIDPDGSGLRREWRDMLSGLERLRIEIDVERETPELILETKIDNLRCQIRLGIDRTGKEYCQATLFTKKNPNTSDDLTSQLGTIDWVEEYVPILADMSRGYLDIPNSEVTNPEDMENMTSIESFANLPINEGDFHLNLTGFSVDQARKYVNTLWLAVLGDTYKALLRGDFSKMMPPNSIQASQSDKKAEGLLWQLEDFLRRLGIEYLNL